MAQRPGQVEGGSGREGYVEVEGRNCELKDKDGSLPRVEKFLSNALRSRYFCQRCGHCSVTRPSPDKTLLPDCASAPAACASSCEYGKETGIASAGSKQQDQHLQVAQLGDRVDARFR